MPKSAQPSRREILAGAAALAFAPTAASLLAQEKKPRFKIGACDWSIGKHQQFEAIDVAKKLGLDGVQVSFDDQGKKTDLRSEEARRQYQEKAKATGVEIASLAMGCLNNVPYATMEPTEQWVLDCIDTMEKM